MTPHNFYSGTVTSTAVIESVEGTLFTLQLDPGASTTAKIEVSADPNTSVWTDWQPGTVSTSTVSVFYGPLSAVRITRASGSATVAYAIQAKP